jgi:tetratricopeptide (TPR) repeat protein
MRIRRKPAPSTRMDPEPRVLARSRKTKRSADAQAAMVKSFRRLTEGRPDEAIRGLDPVIAANPRDTDAWYFRGSAQQDLGDLDGALESFEKVLTIDSGDGLGWAGKAMVLAEMERHEEAVQHFARATQLKPGDDTSWSEMGRSLSRLGRDAEAVAAFDRAIEANPRNTRAWRLRGYALESAGEREEALKNFDRAVQLDPQSANAWNDRGVSLAQYGVLLREHPEIGAASPALRDDFLAYLLSEAVKSWKTALRIEPGHKAAQLNMRQLERRQVEQFYREE